MRLLLSILFIWFSSVAGNAQQQEIRIIHELFRLRNEHKADSVELLYADTVQVYMKYLKNVPRRKITAADRKFWKSHPKNKFEMTEPVQVVLRNGVWTAIIFGKEFLDGTSFKKERIEIKFNRDRKIVSFRGFSVK